jgi:DNA segregation ATPase FtsK/SpoIIIE, S-DNA-T family
MPKRGRKKKRVLPSLHLKPTTMQTILFVFFMVMAAISVVSFLQNGPLPIQYNEFLNKNFGFASVIVPFLLVLIGLSFSRIKIPLKEANVSLGSLVIFISVISLFQQGVLGHFFWAQIVTLWGKLAAFLIFTFTFIVGFVVLFDTDIVSIAKTFTAVFKAFRRYTLGNPALRSKDKKLPSTDPLYIRSENNNKNEVKERDEIGVVNIPPVMKNISTVGSITSPNQSQRPSQNQIWEYPPISIFDDTPGAKADRGDVRKNAQIIENTLDSFGIEARVKEVNDSPSVTQYALAVALGTKLAKIVSLSNDLAMALSAPGGQIRVEAPIPGKNLVGIEVPNHSLEVVPIRKVLESEAMKQAKSKIIVPLGLDVAGKSRIADIAKMPHVLIAGQTGSGKSVCVNSWISTLLFRASPEEVRMIMVDPKRVELTPYNGIPHLLVPVITEPQKVISALKWAVGEMETRYKQLNDAGAKNIESYNNMAGFQSMPYIIIIIDELAEIIMFSPSEVEDHICRIAQMARAVGIHLVLATQRPSVNVITGLIKANIPTRIAFAVSSMTDSRVILDTPGAEKLLGRGDMLYIPPELAKPVRIQGCFVSDNETSRLIEFLKNKQTVNYNNDVISQPTAIPGSKTGNVVRVDGEDHDALFNDAVAYIKETNKASATLFQRHFRIGFARAGSLLDELERAGIVGPVNGAKPREILLSRDNSSNIAG